MANLFISHRKDDDAEAERLATELRSAGHKVWLDLWQVALGDSIIGRMEEGLLASEYVIVCYSSSGATSPWMSREWMSSLARQLERKGITLLPVRLTGGEPPAILSDILYADLTTDWGAGVAQLLRAIK